MSPTVYLVTGANRGIGLALVQSLSARPDIVVVAGTRTLPLPDDHPLSQLAKKLPEVVYPVRITSANEEDNRAAAEYVKEKMGKVDVIIANAGAAAKSLPALQTPAADMLDLYKTNTIGPLVLYQAFSSLLLVSDRAKFVVVSSNLGSIADMFPFPCMSYGASKAGGNYVVTKINQEVPEIIAFPIHPGMVDTDMCREGMAQIGKIPKEMGAITPADSANAMLEVIDKATKESHGGKFWKYDGEEMRF